MFLSKESPHVRHNSITYYLRSDTFQRILIGIITLLVIFLIVESGAVPKKYRLNIDEKSSYDILAPRDIENKLRTIWNAEAAAKAVPSVMTEITTAPIDVINNAVSFSSEIEYARKGIVKSLQEQEIDSKHEDYAQYLEKEQQLAVTSLGDKLISMGVLLSAEQMNYLVSKVSDEDLDSFKKTTIELVSNVMKQDVTVGNLLNRVSEVQSNYQVSNMGQELKIIGGIFAKSILKPNRAEDIERTKEARNREYENAIKNKEMINKDSRIISKGDIVSQDKLVVLEELNLLETASRFDVLFAIGIFVILLLLAVMLVFYMNHFCRNILYSRSNLILLCVVMVLTLLIARAVYEYSPLAMPVFMAAMMISILLDLELAGVVNCILVIVISFITKGDLRFIYIAFISGAFSAFLASKANQRSRLSMAGIIVGFLNVLIIISLGIINNNDVQVILRESIIVFLNGIVSMVLTIGLLPFCESIFNIVTPLKLLELTNPNQPIIKRLLMEAPGTYHHSLMVANLAEVAAEIIGGDALLARVGAYFHDIGKLKRPNFFVENQLADNPHDRMTANLSTLVITSHTRDGVELARKYKIPSAIRDIIKQHHGTTLVVYFYHKARKGERGDSIKQESFRYEGPKPSTKEAAVVMLADSVEAAVRSMIDKTEGKIEGLVRKIIKDKLDDGQLDLCMLTLKDLDDIAKAFMNVLSGFFHEREKYPVYDPIEAQTEVKNEVDEGKVANGDFS